MMRYFTVFILFCFYLGTSQEKVPVDLTFEYNDDLTYYEVIAVGQPDLDTGVTLGYMEDGYLPYEGFQYVKWYEHKAPIHLEEDDSFTVVLGANYNKYEYYYTGGTGAVKNNYLLERQRVLQNLEKSSKFREADQTTAQQYILEKKDSLLAVVKSLSLSDKFIEDENKFWNYYSTYHQVFHDVLRTDNTEFTTLNINSFPVMEFDKKADHFNYRRYLDLSIAYYYHKILLLDDYDQMKDAVKNIDSKLLKWLLIQSFKNQVLKRHPRSEDFIKLVSRFSFNPAHYRMAKKVYNKRNRLSIGDPFPVPEVTDFFDKDINLEKAKGKKAFIFVYNATDKNLEYNFLTWNKFFVEHKSSNPRFLTLGLNTDRYKAVFKEFFLKSQFAGSHLSLTTRDSQDFIENLGLGYGPFIVELDDDWNIVNFDVPYNLLKSNLIQTYPSVIQWKPKFNSY